MIDRAPFSYRDDPEIPPFPDDAPVIVYDGVCVLCSRWVGFVIDRDPEARFVAGQSTLGQALFRHYDLDAVDFETWLLVDEGRCFGGLTGVARMLRRWGRPWTFPAALIGCAPRRLGDWLYRRIARNRYRIFGRRDVCMVPTAALRARFIAWS